MEYLLPFVLAMVITVAGLPVLVRFANRWLLVDHPGTRKVHTVPIPRVGGLAMACGVLVAALVAIPLQSQDAWFLISAGVLILFGALDDRLDLDYRVKLIGQITAVSIVIIMGDVQIRTLTLDDRITLPGWVSLPLTFVFLVGITNAINLADGLDGLAGGTTFLCLGAIALLSLSGTPGIALPLTLAFAGAVLGFLRFNTFPASVFMGDAGSQLLGFATGVLSLRTTQNVASQVSTALPVLLLALPILDTTSVMVQRISEGRSPFSADKNHFHHKLLKLGLDHHEAVMVIYLIQAALFVLAYFLRYESDLLILAVVTAFFILTIGVLQIATRTGWRLRARGTAVQPGPISRAITKTFRSSLLPRISYVVIAGALGTYAGLVVADAARLSWDLHVLVIAMLAIAVLIFGIMRVAPMSMVEKAVLYVTATVLIYLDVLVLPITPAAHILSWVAIGMAAAAIVIRLRLENEVRFKVTPLDVLVVFMALVVPSLPGSLGIPQGGALALVKVVVVFYGIEVLVSRSEDKAFWVRIGTASVLAGLTVRSYVSF